MKIIGITGGIASGKSNVCSVIRAEGYNIIDCDEISKTLTLRGNLLYEAILKAFGSEYLTGDNEIDRKKLGRKIFNDTKARELLNSITHPIILNELKRRISLLDSELVFVEVPLLFESGFDKICDKIICIYLDRELQIKRLIERENIAYDYALSKVNSQMDLKIKRDKADYIIDSSGTFSNTRNQVIALLNKLKLGVD